jgi:hypothetical protein
MKPEDRALLEHAAGVRSCRIDGRVVARWLASYDAALSRIDLLEQYAKAQAEANQTLADASKEALARRDLKTLVSRALVIWLEVDARGSVTAEDWTRIGEALSEAGLPAEWKP